MYTVNRNTISQWVNLLEEKGSARLRVLSQLGRMGIQGRGKRGPYQRGSLRAPARSFLTPANLAQLLEALSDPAPVVRRETVFVLGELGGEMAISALWAAASAAPTEPNADAVQMRLIAVDALAKIGGPQAVQALAQVLRPASASGEASYESNQSELVRARAVYALGQLARGEEGPEVEPIREALTRVREEDASAYVRDAAREVLCEPNALEGEEIIEVPTPIPEPL